MSRFARATSAARRGFRQEWRKPDPAVLRWTALIAWLWVAGWVIGTVASLVTDLGGVSITVDLPVNATWLPLGSDATLGGSIAHLSDGSVTALHVTVTDPPLGARLLYALGHVLVGLGNITVALAVRSLIRRLRTSEPFAGALSRTITIVAGVVIVAGLASQGALAVAPHLITSEAFGSWSAEMSPTMSPPETGTMVGIPQGFGTISIDFWPIGVGLVLLVLARLVRVGERLQRDTAGLV